MKSVSHEVPSKTMEIPSHQRCMCTWSQL